MRPKYDESFDAVGECVRLVGPCNVGRRHQRDGDPAVSRCWDEFMNSPVLKDKTQQEHHYSKGVESDGRRHLAIAQAFPDPFQNRQRNSVDQPERKNTSYGFR